MWIVECSANGREREKNKEEKRGRLGRERTRSNPYPTPRCFFSAHVSLRCPLEQASTVCEGFHLNNHTKDSLKWSWKVITAAFFTFWHVSRVDSRYLTLLEKGRQKWRPSLRTSSRVLLKWLKKHPECNKYFVKQVFAYLWQFFFSFSISLPFWQPLQNSETRIPKGSCKKRLNLSDKTTAYGENTRVYLLNLAYLDRHRPFIANRAESWPRHDESVSYK